MKNEIEIECKTCGKVYLMHVEDQLFGWYCDCEDCVADLKECDCNGR